MMLNEFTRFWWLWCLRGALAILLGVFAFWAPCLNLQVVLAFFGIYALLDGLLAITVFVGSKARFSRRWLSLFEGMVSSIAGLVAFLWPNITALAILFLIATWAIISGLFMVMAAIWRPSEGAIRSRREREDDWLLGVSGASSVLLGALLLSFPNAGLIAWAWMIGAYAFFSGVLLLFLGWKLRQLGRTLVGTHI